MAAREECIALLEQGKDPIEISKIRGVTLGTTLGYLDQMIGRGRIQRSDVLFSLPKDVWGPIVEHRKSKRDASVGAVVSAMKRKGIDVTRDHVEIVDHYGGDFLGDMYAVVRSLEVNLHRLIRETLEECFGKGEAGWWRRGVGLEIRQDCVRLREADEDPDAEAYAYTNLIHLKKIIEKNWNIFSRTLPRHFVSDRKQFLKDLHQLNSLRNRVMHPLRGNAPDEEAFYFLRKLRSGFGFSLK